MARLRRRGRRGFTLVECVAAVVIVATAVPPMLWAVRTSSNRRVNTVLASRARWLAAEKLEDIIADRHSTTRGYTYLLSSNYPAESSVSGFTQFSRSVTLAETAADLTSAGTGYMKVTVSVGFSDAAGVSRTLTLSTELTDYTP